MSLRRQITEHSHLLYAAYCRGRLGQSPQGSEDCAQMAAQVLGAQDQHSHPQTPLRCAAQLAEIVADLLDPPALSKPVSGAAIADAASAPGYREPGYRAPGYREPGYRAPGYRAPGYRAPGYRAPELRERVAQTARCLGHGCVGVAPGSYLHGKTCPAYAPERAYTPPSKDGVGAVEVQVGEQALGSRVFVTDSDLYLRCGGQAAFAQLIDPGKTGKWSSAVSLLARTDACSVTLEAAGVREGLSGYTPVDFAAKFPNLATCAALKAIALAWTYAGGQEMPPQVQRYDELATYWLEMLAARRKCGTRVPERFVELDTWPWPAVRAAIALIDPGSVRIAMDRDSLTVSGPLTAAAKADPEQAFRSLPDLRQAAPADKPAPLDLWSVITAGSSVRLHPAGKPGVITKVHVEETVGGEGVATLTIDFGRDGKGRAQ